MPRVLRGFSVVRPAGGGLGACVVSQKFIEEQQQILRLTTPNPHPTNEDLFVGTPEKLKSTPGAPFTQDDGSFGAVYF
jgi:hypothetical protein